MPYHPSAAPLNAYGFTTRKDNRVTITELPDADIAITVLAPDSGLVTHLVWEYTALAQLHDAIGKFLNKDKPPGST